MKKAARRRRKPAKRTPRTRRKAAPRTPTLRTVLLGAPIELIYKHAQGGTYSHKFTRGTRVSVSDDGRLLVIDGVSVKKFIEG